MTTGHLPLLALLFCALFPVQGIAAEDEQWQEHTIEFEIKTTFKDETTLRFSLPHDAQGTFDLDNTRLKVAK